MRERVLLENCKIPVGFVGTTFGLVVPLDEEEKEEMKLPKGVMDLQVRLGQGGWPGKLKEFLGRVVEKQVRQLSRPPSWSTFSV